MATARDSLRTGTRYPFIAMREYGEGKPSTGHETLYDSQNLQYISNTSRGMEEVGVLKATCSRKWFTGAYGVAFFITFVNSLQQLSGSSWTPYVTSAFKLHGLTGITDVASDIVGGVSKLPLAKFINVVGRSQGFLICILCTVVGLTLMAAGQNVVAYCAAQVFYWIGMNGIDYLLNVFIIDSSSLRNTALIMAFQSSPYICNAFAGPAISEAFLKGPGWRWGYGTWTILTTAALVPMWAALRFEIRKGKRKVGLGSRERSGRNVLQSIKFWSREFDAIGLFLLCTGLTLFLIPFSLTATYSDGWKSAAVICMIVMGGMLIIAFVIYEKFFSEKMFFPLDLIKDRSVLGACFLGLFSWISFYTYKMYFTSYIQVVYRESVSEAGFVDNIYSVVSCIWLFAVGLTFKKVRRYRWAAISAVPGLLLVTGLMIRYRQPSTPISVVITLQIFQAIFGANLNQVLVVAIQASLPSDERRSYGIAIMNMFASIGGSFGKAISGAIWTQTLPARLRFYLPDDAKSRAADIYGDIQVQLSFAWETLEREAIVKAYGDTMMWMLITGTVTLIPCFF